MNENINKEKKLKAARVKRQIAIKGN